MELKQMSQIMDYLNNWNIISNYFDILSIFYVSFLCYEFMSLFAVSQFRYLSIFSGFDFLDHKKLSKDMISVFVKLCASILFVFFWYNPKNNEQINQ